MVMPKDISAGKKSPYRVVINGVISVSAAAAVVFMAASLTGPGLFSRLMENASSAADRLASDPGIISAFNLEEATAAQRSEFFLASYESFISLAPVYIMVLAAVVSYIAYIILSRALGKHKEVRRMPPFREFSFPPGALMALVAMYFAGWIMTSSEMLESDMFYLNISAVFDFAFSIQGISVIFMLFHMKRIPKGFAAAAAAALWITFIGRNILLILGMIDMVLNLKLLIQLKNSK